MPLYEGLSLGSDKHSVVINIGRAYTKCGFVHDYAPRAIIRTEIFCKPINKVVNIMDLRDKEHLRLSLKSFIEMMYFQFLAVNPKDRRVILVENILCESFFKKTLVDVLYKDFDVPSLLIVPEHLTALMTLKIATGIVVDVGYRECVLIPVIEGVTVLDAAQYAPLAGNALHNRIFAELQGSGSLITEFERRPIVASDSLSDKTLENIKARLCFVPPRKRSVSLQVSQEENQPSPPKVNFPVDGSQTLEIPGKIRESAADVFFVPSEHELTIPQLVIEALKKCSVDSRKVLADNIVLIGGTCMLPGFKERFAEELRYLAQESESKQEKFPLTQFKFHKSICKENYVSWLGASIFGSTDAVNTRSVSRDQYLQGTHKILSDWSTWYPNKR